MVVFSKPTRDQMTNPGKMQSGWNERFTSFIEILNGRWGISPNSDYFDSAHRTHRDCLDRIKQLIAQTPGVYGIKEFAEVRRNYESSLLQKQEEVKLAEKNRIENERKVGRDEATRIYKDKITKIEHDSKERDEKLIIALAAIGIVVVIFLAYIYPGVFIKVGSSIAGVINRFFGKLKKK